MQDPKIFPRAIDDLCWKMEAINIASWTFRSVRHSHLGRQRNTSSHSAPAVRSMIKVSGTWYLRAMIAKWSMKRSAPERRRKRPAMNVQQLRTRLSQSMVISPRSALLGERKWHGNNKYTAEKLGLISCDFRVGEEGVWSRNEDVWVEWSCLMFLFPSPGRRFNPCWRCHRQWMKV